MKRKIKKLISVILCAALMLTSIPLFAFASERAVIDSGFCGKQGENLTWTLYDDGELVISGEGEMKWYHIDSEPLYPEWFEHYDKIDVITVEEGVTTIGTDAFYSGAKDKGYSPALYYKITLPKTLNAFYGLSFDENRIPGRHLAICYAGNEEEWSNVWGNFTSKRDVGVYFNGKEPAEFCEIKKTAGEVDIITCYYAPEAAKIEWYTINRGEATKVGETSSRNADPIDIAIPDYKKGEVYLQAILVDADGNPIISSQELYLGKNPTAIDYIKYYFRAATGNLQFLGFWVVVVIRLIPELFRMMIKDIIA